MVFPPWGPANCAADPDDWSLGVLIATTGFLLKKRPLFLPVGVLI